MKKILKKFTKNYFAIKDNTINQKLVQIIDQTSFKIEEGKMTRQLEILSDDILSFYSDFFH